MKAGGEAVALATANNEAQARLDSAMRSIATQPAKRPAITQDQIKAALAEHHERVATAATAADRKALLDALDLSLRFDPIKRILDAEFNPLGPSSCVRVGGATCVRVGGGTCTITPRPLPPGSYEVA